MQLADLMMLMRGPPQLENPLERQSRLNQQSMMNRMQGNPTQQVADPYVTDFQNKMQLRNDPKGHAMAQIKERQYTTNSWLLDTILGQQDGMGEEGRKKMEEVRDWNKGRAEALTPLLAQQQQGQFDPFGMFLRRQPRGKGGWGGISRGGTGGKGQYGSLGEAADSIGRGIGGAIGGLGDAIGGAIGKAGKSLGGLF